MPVISSPAPRGVWLIRGVICGYWCCMFLATHLPVERAIEQVPASDKQLHFAAYGLLGLLLPFWSQGVRSDRDASDRLRLAVRRGMRLIGILWVYAIADELLQIPVGRSAEFLDWMADAIGAVFGVAVGGSVRYVLDR